MDDIGKASAVVADMRKIIRQDPRIIQKLHRRVFFDKLTREQVRRTLICIMKRKHRVRMWFLSDGSNVTKGRSDPDGCR